MRELDKIDHKILQLLQGNGRMSMTELADAVGLSVSPVAERVRNALTPILPLAGVPGKAENAASGAACSTRS